MTLHIESIEQAAVWLLVLLGGGVIGNWQAIFNFRREQRRSAGTGFIIIDDSAYQLIDVTKKQPVELPEKPKLTAIVS